MQWLLVAAVAGWVFMPTLQAGSILREVWEGIPGTLISDLTNAVVFPNSPTLTNFVTDYFEAPTDVMENYGQQLHGYIVPPVSGTYTFWIASDDAGELWLSTDADPAHRKRIANVAGWTPSREWGWEANQKSSPISLEAGKTYYVAALQKEGGGGDNLAVRWLRPDGLDEAPIPANYLLPYGTSFTPPTIAQQPTNLTTIEGQTATFKVQVSNLDLVNYRWQRNGVDLPNADGAILQFGPVALSDNNARFQAFLSNQLGNTNTDTAVLTVVADTIAPVVLSASNQGRTTVVLVYSEAVDVTSALNPSNYSIDNGASIAHVTFGSDSRTVLLTTSLLNYNASYTLTISGVKDRASLPNLISPGTHASFTAVEYVPADIGSPGLAGGNLSVPGGVDVTGAGKSIGGVSDQFQFSWVEKNGDFDLQTRVTRLTLPDPYVRAGLMLRESLSTNARFAAVFAGSPQLGCFFESRSGLGITAATAAPRGGFPVNYPFTWLRLQRQGATLNGYASLDARSWTSLGSVSLSSLPTKAYFGFAVSSDTTNAVAAAQFRNIGPTQTPVLGTVASKKEPFGPSSRATGMVISEIMYHPAPRSDGRKLEFIELANARSVPEDLTGWRISGAVDYTFPNGFRLLAGEFVVVAAVPDDIKAVYGITNVLGPYSGSLPGDSGTIRLRNNEDAIRLEVTYSDEAPWPVAADGTGHSLVLARPSFGEAQAAAWAASELIGGSPGGMDPVIPTPLGDVVINEFLAHTDLPQVDYVELYNHSNSPVDLTGCWISDDPATNKFQIPGGTTIAARGFVSFDSTQLGFRLHAAGETIYFVAPDHSRVLDAVSFGGQANGISSGRFPDGDPNIRRLAYPTPAQSNASWRQEDVVINEIMYAPISGDSADQYVELYNRSALPVDLSGWKFTHGISFKFPENTTLGAQSFLVIANNAAHLQANYPQLTAANCLGDFGGNLSDNGDRLVLSQPHWLISTNSQGASTTNLIHMAVTEVTYGTGGRWGQWAKGGGSSLELIDPDADPLRAANWADSDETAKAPWTTVAVTNRLDNGDSNYSPTRFRIGMQGAGECLIDSVEVFKEGSTNLLANGGFESGPTGWSFFGNHSLSTVESTGAADGLNCLHMRGQDGGDTGPNTVRTTVLSGLSVNSTGVIRAKVRWLKGWPEVLFGLRGNHLELPARMVVPTNLGTPGQPNSRLVANAGPAIFDVTHIPALPRSGEPVKVVCRASDPDGIGSLRLQYRVDPGTTLQTITMKDDGTGGDELGGDGVYTGIIPAPSGSSLVAFRITARDNMAAPGTTVFPAAAPAQECLIRWDDTVPFGTFAHYHLWNTAAIENARNSSGGLNNTWRHGTLVYGNFRVVYNAGFRDKGSPYHSGYGDMVVTVPEDDLVLGTTERNFASTGNGGPEQTDIRSQLAAWLAQELGLPYLHAHYVRFYRNGGLFRSICEDLEVPHREYTRRWFPDGGRGDFYKVSVWFEFADNNQSPFDATGCTLQRFTTLGGAPKLARYRWIWARRPDGGTANNYTNIFELVDAANDNTSNYTARLMELADMEQWMRVFAYHRMMGNWDSWTYNVGQNMFALKQPGLPWKLVPWDIDFTFGLGDGTTSALGGGTLGGNCQDPIAVKMYNNPTFRRMLWRAYQDALAGPFLAQNYAPQIDARRSILQKNQVTDAADPRAISTYIEQRRAYIQKQLTANDAGQFAITSNGGADFTSSTPTATVQGTAPFAVATIEVNGVPYPVTWLNTTNFQILTALASRTNVLTLVGKDRHGQAVPGASRTVTVTYSGSIPLARDFIVVNELQYNPLQSGASFIELYNRSSSVPFDLSGYRVDGLKYTFPPGAIIQPNAYLLLVKDRAAFARTFGATVAVFDEFAGSLDNNGEHISLVDPGATPAEDQIISDIRYESILPWPTNAAGLGPSLQLVDSNQDAYRVANWATTATNDVNQATPGRLNAVAQGLDPFSSVWINEVQPGNPSAPADNTGQAGPWLELYNAGTSSVDLSAFYLTDDYTRLTQWRFPVNTVLSPGQFLVVWADGRPEQTTPTALHASFRLSSTAGAVALVRIQGSPPAPAVLDYVNYSGVSAGRSYGSLPDGEPRHRQLLQHITPGAANDPVWTPVTVTINELMAANSQSLTDPATGQFESWFELSNGSASEVDLSAYELSNSLTNTHRFIIPAGTTIPASGFLLCWADQQTSANRPGTPLHVDFKLDKDGEELALFDPAGKLVDGLSFGAQINDVSIGRLPDGGPLPLSRLDKPTPGESNDTLTGNRLPIFSPLTTQTVSIGTTLQFTVKATDPDSGQHLFYSLGTNAPTTALINAETGTILWTPTPPDGPGTYSFDVRATDDGAPPRTAMLRVTVVVAPINSAPSFSPVAAQSVPQGQPLTVQLQATDKDLPANTLAYSLDPGAPEGALVDPKTGLFSWTPSPAQFPGNYSVTARVTDNGIPPLSTVVSFAIAVTPAPQPPVLAPILPQMVNERTGWQLAVQATDSDSPSSPMVYSLDVYPEGAHIDAQTGLITWTPAEAQGPTNAVFVVRATKSAPPNLSATATFSVSVAEVNQGPSLAPLADQVIALGQPYQLPVKATDPDLPPNRLTFSLEPGAPAGLTINPETGLLNWTPASNQVPSTNRVTVRVVDDGTPPLSAADTFTVTVKRGAAWKYVTATGTASASTLYIYLTSPGEVYVDDVVLVAGDQPGAGPNLLRNGDFESSLLAAWVVSPNLVASATEGAIIHSGQRALHVVASSGGTTRASAIYQDISPALESGAACALSFWYLPGTNDTSLTVRLSGNGINTVTPIKALVNAAPVLGPLANRVLAPGETLRFTATATDADLPNDELVFSVDPPVPAGAVINPATGEFTWQPDASQAPSTNRIVIRVSDGSTPPLSDSHAFTVVVQAPTVGPIMATLTPAGLPTFTWDVLPGRKYRVEVKDSLSAGPWQTFADLDAVSSRLSFTDQRIRDFAQRYYRILLLP